MIYCLIIYFSFYDRKSFTEIEWVILCFSYIFIVVIRHQKKEFIWDLTVSEGKSMAIMSAFNYIGNKYAGANPELLNRVLRDEWGFRGMVLTDYFGGYGYQDSDIQIRNGGDFCLSPQMIEVGELTDKTSGTSLQAARQACKNILYTTANSRAYANGAGGGMYSMEEAAEYEAYDTADGGTQEEGTGQGAGVREGRKLIQTVGLEVETKEFLEAHRLVNKIL